MEYEGPFVITAKEKAMMRTKTRTLRIACTDATEASSSACEGRVWGLVDREREKRYAKSNRAQEGWGRRGEWSPERTSGLNTVKHRVQP